MVTDEYEEEEEMEDDYIDPEILRMEEELQLLLQQNPEIDEEEGENTPKMRMHADEEEEQIVLRR